MKILFPEKGMRYWDDFDRRAHETAAAIAAHTLPPLRRVSVHITNGCNFGCSYCNEVRSPRTLPLESFTNLVIQYSEMGGGIVHVTGGEPTIIRGFSDYIAAAADHSNIAFHLNSNLFRPNIPDHQYRTIQRLKVSLDSSSASYFDKVVRRSDAFGQVTANLDHVHNLIAEGKADTLVSLTFTVTSQNYRHIPEFLEMYGSRWPKFYAAFFSSYKGSNPDFVMTPEDTHDLFTNIAPMIDRLSGDETRMLFHASHEPRTFSPSERFPEVRNTPCWLQLSELVVNEDGDLSNCSHLYRDGVRGIINLRDGHLSDLFRQIKSSSHTVPMNEACIYGCNKKLTTFNRVVDSLVSEIAQ